MNSFNFDRQDLDELLGNLWLPRLSLEALGLTDNEYNTCRKLENLYIDKGELSDDVVFFNGFCDIDDFKEAYIKYLIYNAIYHTPHTSLKQFLNSFYQKAKCLTTKPIPRVPTEGDVVSYLRRYDLDELLMYYY